MRSLTVHHPTKILQVIAKPGKEVIGVLFLYHNIVSFCHRHLLICSYISTYFAHHLVKVGNCKFIYNNLKMLGFLLFFFSSIASFMAHFRRCWASESCLLQHLVKNFSTVTSLVFLQESFLSKKEICISTV